MKSPILFSIATCITFLTSVSLPVAALTIPNAVQSTNNRNNITLAKNTAIIISFPSSMTIDVSEKQEFPLTVFLNKPITDSQGNVLVPENSPVSIILKPTDKGAKIVAQSLVVNGQVVPIQASSPTIPGANITHKTGHEKAEENGSVWGKIGESAFGFAGGTNPQHSERGSMLGKTLGLVTGLNSPTKSRQVKINENSVYILSLEASVDLSAR